MQADISGAGVDLGFMCGLLGDASRGSIERACVMRPGRLNLITDVAGLVVGNAADSELKSGVTVLTADRQNLEVDAFARYRIVDPLRFYQAVGNIALANQRLASFTNSGLRNVLAEVKKAIERTGLFHYPGSA